MLLCWPKGSASSIHDHAARYFVGLFIIKLLSKVSFFLFHLSGPSLDSNCWLRVVKGRVHELQYKADAHGALHETVNVKHDAGAVTYIHGALFSLLPSAISDLTNTL
jgi:hypothetical protein